MKNTFKNLFFVSLFIAIGITSALSQNAKYTTLAPKEFKAQQAKDNGFLMDLRTPEQYMTGNIKRSKLCNINDQSFESILDMMEKANPVYVYDQDGKNSVRAAEMMVKRGYTKIYILDGGFDAWKKAGIESATMNGGK